MELFAKKIEKQLASYQQELIETHYREVDNMYRQIRGWRHDYRNHIQTMKLTLPREIGTPSETTSTCWTPICKPWTRSSRPAIP